MFAPNVKLRPKIIPGEKKGKSSPSDANNDAQYPPVSVRISWARLLTRVSDIDINQCLHCGGTLKIIAAILEKAATTKIFNHLGSPGCQMNRYHVMQSIELLNMKSKYFH